MKLHILSCAVLCASCSPGLGPVVPKTKMERQMIGLLEKFDRWDYNGDGYLDRTELAQGIAGLKGKPQEVSYTADEVIDFYDTNRDQRISMQEAQAGYKRSDEAESRLQ